MLLAKTFTLRAKLKLIFNTEKTLDGGRVPTLLRRDSAYLRYHVLSLARGVLAFSMVFAVPALAQQSGSQPPAQAPPTSDAAANRVDPAPDENPEAIFPHFKDTRFWLSGQANF